MAIKKEIDPTVPRKRRGRPPKNRTPEEVIERAKPKRIKPPPPPPPPVARYEEDEDDNDDEEDDEDNITDDGILAGIDPESRTQNRIVQNVLKRREEGGRVPWHGQDNIKYNCASEKCLSLFGAESEVEIVRERPSAHHITLSPLAKFPKWMDVYSFLKETQWDGSAQKYKIMVYSTGRSVAAVCYLTLDEDERRKLEWRKHWEHVRAGQGPAPAQEHVPSWQQQQVPQQQPQAQQPVQPAPQPQQQQSQVQPQPFQQPQPPSPFPQPQQPYNQPLPWQPQGPAWQPQAPQQLQPPWPGGWPQQPPSPFQQPPPFQQQFAQEEEDDDEEDEDEDVEEQAFQPPQRWQREDPKVALLERNIHALTKQIIKLQRSNQKEMAGANSQVAYQQQWQVWQMLTGMNQSLQAMSTQLEEAKRQAAQPPPPPPPPPPMPQQPPPQMMTVDEIMKIVDERMRQPQPSQQPMGMMQMPMGMQMPMMPPAPPPEPTDSLGEIKRTVKQVADLRKMFEDLQPQQPQPPAWMQQMPPPPQAMVQSEAKAEDGSPLKVFEMGPFRYVTDKEGKAVDFFTMMMLNADNVKSWVEPGLKAFGELREQVKDARKKNEMQDTMRMFEQMSNQVMHNQQLQAQQIEQLNQRLAPSQSTIDALQSGNVEVLSSPPMIQKREPQPGPVARSIVPSGQRKSLLDGLANAQRALQSKK